LERSLNDNERYYFLNFKLILFDILINIYEDDTI